jgi:hypothetical protein
VPKGLAGKFKRLSVSRKAPNRLVNLGDIFDDVAIPHLQTEGGGTCRVAKAHRHRQADRSGRNRLGEGSDRARGGNKSTKEQT